GASSPGNPRGDFGNAANGIFINQSAGITVGGTTPGPANGVLNNADTNIISGNHASGVFVSGTATGFNGSPTGTVIEGNLIGTDPTGTRAVANGAYGVLISGSSGNVVGGPTGTPGTGPGNLISGNAQAGIQLINPGGSTVTGNVVLGNLIGTNINGSAALGNGSDGVEIINASGNTIGGAAATARNIISGNATHGVLINQFPTLTASGNQVLGNYIGTNLAGSAAVPNSGD